MFELEKEMQTIQLEKERALRHLEEDFTKKTFELRKELEHKNMILDDEEET